VNSSDARSTTCAILHGAHDESARAISQDREIRTVTQKRPLRIDSAASSSLTVMRDSLKEWDLNAQFVTPCLRCCPPISAVYLLATGGRVEYVGSTDNLAARLRQHVGDARNSGDEWFDAALWVALPSKVLRHYEGAFIRFLSPSRNRAAPRHHGYDNEILDGFGLPQHADEYANAELWEPPTDQSEPQANRIGARIRDARVRAGLSVVEVARLLGVSRGAVYAWEAGHKAPCHENLVALSIVLETTVSDLLQDFIQ
jgi:DNA-binding transcriptional regulator YiaG